MVKTAPKMSKCASFPVVLCACQRRMLHISSSGIDVEVFADQRRRQRSCTKRCGTTACILRNMLSDLAVGTMFIWVVCHMAFLVHGGQRTSDFLHVGDTVDRQAHL